MRVLALTLLLSAALAAPSRAASPLDLGRFEVLGGGDGLVIGAPHGGYDRFTEDVARRVAWLAGGAYVIASGYRTFEHPWNVNRPTAGVGLAADDEARPAEAVVVYEAYCRRVLALEPRLYVEIHGNGRAESKHWIEAATQGLSLAQARALKAGFQARVARLAPGLPRLDLGVDQLDATHYRAMGAKKDGIFTQVGPVLHFELPWAVRGDERARAAYAYVLAQTVREVLADLR